MSERETGMAAHPDMYEMRRRLDGATLSAPEKALIGISPLVAGYLVLSPWIVGFSNRSNLTVSNVGAGALYLLLVVLVLFDSLNRLAPMMVSTPLLGIWVVVSPWAVSGNAANAGTISSNVASGVVATFVGMMLWAYASVSRNSTGELAPGSSMR